MSDPPDHTGSDTDTTPITGVTLGTDDVRRQLETPSATLGRYVVLATLGKGGMGTVYRAYDPKLQREVALKQVRSREDEVRARVLREARAMARLSHPNVVAVYDVDDSVEPPLVAMEYVPGITLRRWLQKVRPWRQIAGVFEKVGRGLQAAHDAKLVHRDFKPSNVLITSVEDGRSRRRRVLVADFGLAREIDAAGGSKQYVSVDRPSAVFSSTSDSTVSTRVSGVQGTPRYMAPEQHEGLESDARTDQYAFCLAAWEALSGKYPFPRTSEERIQAKREGPPKWTGALHVPRPLVTALRRGLEPDPDDRWPTLEPVIDILARHTERRRRPAAWLIGAGVLTLGGLGGFAWWTRASDVCSGAQAELARTWNESQRARLSRAFADFEASFAARAWSDTQTALDAFGDAWVQAHAETCRAADRGTIDAEALDLQMLCLRRARQSMASTIDVLGGMNAQGASLAHEVVGRLPAPRACTDLAALKEHRWSVPPDLEAAVDETRSEIERARSLRAAGRLEEARKLAREASIRADELGFAPLRAEALLAYGDLRQETRTGAETQDALLASIELALQHDMKEVALHGANSLIREYSGATPRFDLAERIAGFARPLAEGPFAGTSQHARTLDSVSFLRSAQGEIEEALALAQASYELQAELHGHDDLRTAKALNNLGLRYDDLERYDDALRVYRQALEIKEAELGETHPVLMTTLMNLGNIARVRGRFDEAMARHQRALAISEDVFGPDHPETASLIDNIGIVYYDRREYEEALSRFERALGIMEMSNQPEAPAAYRYRTHIASTSRLLGDLDRSIALSLQCLAYYRRTLGPQHQRTTAMLNNLGNVYKAAGRLDEAAEVLRESLRVRLATSGPKHPAVLQSRRNLGALLHAQDRFDEAYRMLTTAVNGYRELESPLRIDLAEVLGERGEVSLARGRPQEAVDDAREALKTVQGQQGITPLLAELHGLVARASWQLGDRAAAREAVDVALELAAESAVDFEPEQQRDLEELRRKLKSFR